MLDFFKSTYPNSGTFKREEEEWRAYIGRFGITGELLDVVSAQRCFPLLIG